MNSDRTSSVRWSIRPRRLGDPEFFTQLGKVPPQAVEIEEAVLGALMLERDALSNVIQILKPENFYKDAHQEIYSSIVELFKGSEPVDILTVTNHLRKKGKLESVGGPYYITSLTARINSSANAEYHARIIIEMSIKRELIRISSEIQEDAYEESRQARHARALTSPTWYSLGSRLARSNISIKPASPVISSQFLRGTIFRETFVN